MRFKIGSKVEVMNNREVPISWRTGEILSSNKDTYTVRYDRVPLLGMAREAPAERVSRKLVRPCPPPVEGVENFVAGDIVEVFDNFSWKIASILKAVPRDQYLVRVLGCSEEFCIHRSKIRVRRVWEDDMWTMLGKGMGGCGLVKFNKLSASNCYQKMSFRMPQSDAKARSQATKRDCLALQSNAGLEESHVLPSRSRKRKSHYCLSIIESSTRDAQKRRAFEKDGRRERVISAPDLVKVDAVVHPQEILGERYMYSSFNDKAHGCIELERLDRDLDCSPSRSSEANGYDSDASSVGSCSVTCRTTNNFPISCVPVPCQVTDSICSDAESSYGSVDEDERCNPPEEEVAANIHRATIGRHASLAFKVIRMILGFASLSVGKTIGTINAATFLQLSHIMGSTWYFS